MYENTTYEVILERMLSRVSDKFDKREGSLIFDAHSPAAIEFQLLYLELEQIMANAYGDTASREYLIKRCAERGITPQNATQAILKGVFYPANIDVTGRRFNIGEVNFEAIEKMSDGIYKVRCESSGTVGNQQLGTMIPIDYIDGLASAELTGILIPGEDEEDTESLRKRYFESFNDQAFGGNIQDYLDKTNAIPGVGSTKVKSAWNADIAAFKLIPTASVKDWYESVSNSLSGEPKVWLDAVFSAAEQKKLTTGGAVLLTILNSDFDVPSQDLVDEAQRLIDPNDHAGEGCGIAPIGHVVRVQGAQGIKVYVETELAFLSGYSWDNLQSSIDAAVSKYLLELRKTWADEDFLTVRISQIEARILQIPGIADVTGTKLNSTAENIILGVYEIPLLGGVSVC